MEKIDFFSYFPLLQNCNGVINFCRKKLLYLVLVDFFEYCGLVGFEVFENLASLLLRLRMLYSILTHTRFKCDKVAKRCSVIEYRGIKRVFHHI